MALIGLTLAFEWAAVIGLAGLVITSAQAIGEGTTDPVLIIWLMIVETSSNLAFCVISNAIAGFIARSPARARSPYAPAGPRRLSADASPAALPPGIPTPWPGAGGIGWTRTADRSDRGVAVMVAGAI